MGCQPEGARRDAAFRSLITTALRQRRHATISLAPFEPEGCHHDLRLTPRVRKIWRQEPWTLASLHSGNPDASEPVAILDDLDAQEQNAILPTGTPLTLKYVRDAVPVQHHRSGIDIFQERGIPQPWRERFLQASIGSTRLADGPYATDWGTF